MASTKVGIQTFNLRRQCALRGTYVNTGFWETYSGYISSRPSAKYNKYFRHRNFLELNIKVIGNNIHTSVYQKNTTTWDFQSLISPWVSGNGSRLPSCGIYISQFVRFARYCTDVSVFFFLKTFKSLQNYWLGVTDIKNLGKCLRSSYFRSYSELLS